jgi:predicted anti-sigma-YlaC factor YlaD
MERLTKDEINLVIQQLTEYEKGLREHIKNCEEQEIYYEDMQEDESELAIVTNILEKLRG